jgi:hypothetical protein
MEPSQPRPTFSKLAHQATRGRALAKFHQVLKRSNFDKLKQRVVVLGDLGDMDTVCLRVEGRNEARVSEVANFIQLIWNHAEEMDWLLRRAQAIHTPNVAWSLEETARSWDAWETKTSALLDTLDALSGIPTGAAGLKACVDVSPID